MTTNNPLDPIAAEMAAYIAERGLSQEAFAREFGAPKDTVNRWLKGRAVSDAYRQLWRVFKDRRTR